MCTVTEQAQISPRPPPRSYTKVSETSRNFCRATTPQGPGLRSVSVWITLPLHQTYNKRRREELTALARPLRDCLFSFWGFTQGFLDLKCVSHGFDFFVAVVSFWLLLKTLLVTEVTTEIQRRRENSLSVCCKNSLEVRSSVLSCGQSRCVPHPAARLGWGSRLLCASVPSTVELAS